VPAFIHTIEVDGESTYKKMGYIKPHHRLYNFVKKHQHKDEVKFSSVSMGREGRSEGRGGREGGRKGEKEGKEREKRGRRSWGQENT